MVRPGLLLFFAAVAFGQQSQKWTYPLPPENQISFSDGVEYRVAGGVSLKFDLYRPKAASAPTPVVLFVNGIGSPDLRKWEQYTSWGRAVTARGLAGVTFDTHAADVAADIDALIGYLRKNSAQLNLDAENIVVYACSSNVTVGLPFVNQPRANIKGAVIYYGAAEVPLFRLDLPVLLVRAAFDSTGLLRSIDKLVGRALAANAPFTVVNLQGHHGFEVVDDTELARETISRTLDFMKSVVSPQLQREVSAAVEPSAAWAALVAENWQEAIPILERIAKVRPGDSEVQRQLGESYVGAKRYQEALVAFQKALDLGSMNKGLIALSAAICSVRTGANEDALKFLGQVPPAPGLMRRIREEPAFSALRSDPRFPAAAK